MKINDKRKEHLIKDLAEKKMSENALRRFRALVNNNPYGIQEIDTFGTIIFANKAHHDMYGYEEGDLTGRSITDFLVPGLQHDKLPDYLAILVKDQPPPTVYQQKIVTKHGMERDIEVAWNYLRDSKGGVSGFISVLTDITERKKTEKALRESEEKFRSLAESSQDYIMLYDEQCRHLYENPAALTVSGFSEKDIIGKTHSELGFSQELCDVWEEKIRSVFDKGNPTAEIFEWESVKGKVFLDWRLTPMFDEAGKVKTVLGISRDITEHKQSEGALFESEQKYREIVEGTNDLITRVNSRGEFLYVNKVAEEIFGLSADECIGKLAFQFIHPDDRTATETWFNESIQKKLSQANFENRQVNQSNGNVHYMLWAAKFNYNEDDQLLGINSIARDITESKRANDSLQLSHQLETIISQVSTDFINLSFEETDNGLYNALKKIGRFANAVRCSLFLISDDLKTVTNTHEWCADPEDSQINVLKGIPFETFGYYGNLLLQHRNVIIERLDDLPLDKARGERDWCKKYGFRPLIFAPMIFKGNLYGAIGFYGSVDEKRCWPAEFISLLGFIADVFINALERKRSQEALAKHKYSLEKAQKIGAIGTWELDIIKNKLIWTDQNYKNFGVPIGTPLTYEIFINCVHPDDREYVNTEWMAANKGKPYDIEHRIIIDGKARWVREKADVTFDKKGNGIYAIGFTQDITDLKILEEERQKTHKLESIGILAGGIAHDFNNLLSIILNNVYMAKMKVDYKSKAYGNITEIEKALQRATDLTHQLLTFSKGGAPVKKTASIMELIEESAEFVLRGSNVNCEYITIENLWSVEVDKGQMNQVIHNLILNADQSMPEGGTIRIYAENFDLSSGTGLPLKEGRYIKVVVQDQGTGISEEHLKKLFDPYFTTKEIGRGLGLSISYSIIKQHDGHILAESELGVGTTFTIYLPASEKQVEETKAAADALVAGEGKILLMDDEEMIRKSLGEFLTTTGYKVEYAKDGEEAIELYEKAIKASEPFDTVILDLTIRGGMGGKEVVKKLLEINPDVKTIVSSGYSNDPVMANYKEYGFSDVFCKASNRPDDLCRILNKVIKK